MYFKLFSKCSDGARGAEKLAAKLFAVDRSQGNLASDSLTHFLIPEHCTELNGQNMAKTILSIVEVLN